MPSLFELSGNYLKIKELAEQGADEQVIKDTLESIDDEIETKVDNYANLIRHLDGNIEMVKKEQDRLAKIKGTHVNTQKKVKEALLSNMKMMDKQRIKTATNHAYIRKNRTSLVIEDESKVPDDFKFKEEKMVLDKDEFRKYLEENEDVEIEGVRLVQTESVVIK